MIVRYGPCRACGAPDPLDPSHLARATRDEVCRERVSDVQLLIRLREAGEDSSAAARSRLPARASRPQPIALAS